MDYLKNYKSELKQFDEYQFNSYYKKSYILKCYDESKIQTRIIFSIYYTHCNYEIFVEGLHIEETETSKIWHFTRNTPIKITMYETTYKLSKKRIEDTKKFLFLNLNNFISMYEQINKNITVL